MLLRLAQLAACTDFEDDLDESGGAAEFSPNQVSVLVAHWSGSDAADASGTYSSVSNRITGSAVGALAQATANDRPARKLLANDAGCFVTDGSSNSDDLKTTDVAALRFTAKGYWAFWVSFGATDGVSARLLSQWAEGGSTERIDITYEANSDRWGVSIATSATTLVIQRFTHTRAALSLGCWVEFLWDGSQASEADRLQCFVDDVRVSRASTTGNNPTELLAGDAANLWVGSRNSANTGGFYIAHVYVGNDIPTADQRLQLKGYQRPNFTWPNSIVIGGNSIMAGFGLNRVQAPDHLIEQELRATYGNIYGVHLSARDGEASNQQRGTFDDGVTHLLRAGGTNIVVFMEVGNHLVDGATEAAAQTEVETMASEVQALGWLFVVCTCMPRTPGVASWTSDMQTASDNINAAWRLDHSFADGFVDLAADPRLANDTDATHYADGRHTTAAGAAVMVELILAEVETLL